MTSMRRRATRPQASEQIERGHGSGDKTKAYLRFGTMILSSTLVMYGLTYLNTFELSHVRWSETRAYMALLMGGSMAIIMLLFMRHMYTSAWNNASILIGAVLVMATATWLVRSQTTVQDRSYMSAMIPHHSIAILTSERSEITDVRVCDLAVSIIEAQRREIAEMEWLLEDIERNGPATTAAEAARRSVPRFPGTSERRCPSIDLP